MSNFSGAHKHH